MLLTWAAYLCIKATHLPGHAAVQSAYSSLKALLSFKSEAILKLTACCFNLNLHSVKLKSACAGA